MTFDDVLPALVRICESAPGFVDLKRACVVRDLRGRVRLVVDPDPSKPDFALSTERLEASLKAELGGYFAPPIWSTAASKRPDEARLAREIFKQPASESWSPMVADGAGVLAVPARARWFKHERRVSKQEWLEPSIARPPWEIGQAAGIVTFYSFKGGVGRTTALVACAWQLAKQGKRVVVLDLDLEAPGVGVLLGVSTKRGLVDLIVDYLASGEVDLSDAVAEAEALGEDASFVHVVPAGVLGPAYLEKLARLDFVGGHPGADADRSLSPLEHALRAILMKLRSLRPDYVLIDARAGLHDLAGLSLHRFAHVDVLFGRTNEQTYQGLELSVEMLVRRKGLRELECVVAQTMVSPEGLSDAVADEEQFLDRSYDWFRRHVYGKPGARSFERQGKGPHRPVVVRYDSSLNRFATLRSIERSFFAPCYEQLLDRVVAGLKRLEGGA